jgi:hypothetical protein
MGADDETKALILDHATEGQADDYFEILPENVESFSVFARCSTQWNISANGFPTGIDYSALQAIMSMLGYKKPAQIFDEIQLIERGALTQMSDNRPKQGK